MKSYSVTIAVPAWKAELLRSGSDGTLGCDQSMDEWINRRALDKIDREVALEIRHLLECADSRKCSACGHTSFPPSYSSAALLGARFAPVRDCPDCGKLLTAQDDPLPSRFGHDLSAWAKAKLDYLGGADAIRRLLAREAKAQQGIGDSALLKFVSTAARREAKFAGIRQESFPIEAVVEVV